MAAWIRYPTVHDDTVVFVCEDDLWSVPIGGGIARRLTTGLGATARPAFSPDGSRIAFDGAEEGVREVYVVDRDGGAVERRTWHGDVAHVLGWIRGSGPGGGEIAYISAVGQPFAHDTLAYAISAEGIAGIDGSPRVLPYGPISGLAISEEGRAALCRYTADLAWWKGYRGGRMGALWVADEATGRFERLQLDAGAAAPCWAAGRLWFVTDPGGAPQLASCLVEGGVARDLQICTSHDDLAVRFPSTDGRWLVYVHGGDLYRFDVAARTPVPERIDVSLRSQRTRRQRRFSSPVRHLEDYDLHPEGHSLVLTVRGRPFVMGNWEGPVRQLGVPDGVRYQCARWIDDARILAVSDAGGEEALEILSLDGGIRRLDGSGHGRIVTLEVDPKGQRAAFVDHRHRLYLVELEDGGIREIDRSGAGPFGGVAWSQDGSWLAWSAPVVGAGARIRLCPIGGESREPVDVTDGQYRDLEPSFDPNGDHLYFLSYREFDPVNDAAAFDYGFPRGMRPYVVTLRRDVAHPFRPAPRPLSARPRASKADEPLKIDLDGIGDRLVPFPMPDGRYEQIVGVGQGRVWMTRAPIRGMLDRTWYDPGPPKADNQLLLWDFDKQELTELSSRVSAIRPDRAREHVLLRVGPRLRVTVSRPDKAQREDLKRTDGAADRRSGWVELGRLRVSVDPSAEWRQMVREAWRLMRDHFWDPTLGGIDWETIGERYAGLVDRVATRGELSDLVWCMQGELGTSHAYEMGGDYTHPPSYRIGRLGADLVWDGGAGGYRIARVVRGEPGDPERSSPLIAPGAALAAGDVVVAIGGRPVRPDLPLEAELVHRGAADVALAVRRGGDSAPSEVVIRTLADERPLRYRDWVLANRERVHAETDGRVGYVHVPDMGTRGFAEFYRDYGRECERSALIVDVRYNRGGHVSQLLLARIGRKRLGYTVARWTEPVPYPRSTVAGPMVALTNEFAGSDGDIFSHAWKRMGLGPLIGTRTWGGVVGIWPRQLLVDRAVTTQPEYANWFDDVGYGLENYGTDPDVLVPRTPDDWASGHDPQLQRAIAEVMALLAVYPPPPRPSA